MKKRFDKAAFDEQMTGLAGLLVGEIRDRWKVRFRDPPPRHQSKELMLLAFAYRLQAEAFGGLKRRTRAKLDDLAERFTVDSEHRPKATEALKPGTSLIREWNGRRYVVTITDAGCLLDGKAYASLSAAAQAITGTKWNGPRFFHLRKTAESP